MSNCSKSNGADNIQQLCRQVSFFLSLFITLALSLCGLLSNQRAIFSWMPISGVQLFIFPSLRFDMKIAQQLPTINIIICFLHKWHIIEMFCKCTCFDYSSSSSSFLLHIYFPFHFSCAQPFPSWLFTLHSYTNKCLQLIDWFISKQT
jgi:hypothetical protein